MSRAGRYFSRKRGLSEFISGGPLAVVLDDLAEALEAKGYGVATTRGYLRAARHVTYEIERRGLRRRDLTLAGLRAFSRTHASSCRCPHPEKKPSANSYSCMTHLAPILRRRGLADEATVRTPFAEVLAEFDGYAAEVKGLSDDTRAVQRRTILAVLRALMRGDRFEPARLTHSVLQRHVSDLAERYSLQTAHRTASTIRSFLRFLQTRGVDASAALTGLKGPRITRGSLSSRKALTVAQTRALLVPLRQGNPIAMRDLAIVLLLGQVGLRRGDIARLTVHDVDARASTLTVRRSKSRRAFELPMPEEARDAVLRYVRHGRPSVTADALFLSHGFPYDRGITPSVVSGIVARAFRRSGIEHPSNGAHVLRHTLATQLVAARQPIKAVADVMRHRQIDTTARYVRADLDRLREATFPWPEERDVQPRSP